MATATQVTQEVQDRMLETVRVGQKGVVDFVRSWAETVETAFSRFPDMTFPNQQGQPGQPGNPFESAFNFTERLFAAQREFANQLFEATVPAARGASAAANQGTQAAQQATTTKPGR